MWPVGKIGTRLVEIDSKWQGKFLLVITGIFIEEVFDGLRSVNDLQKKDSQITKLLRTTRMRTSAPMRMILKSGKNFPNLGKMN